MTTNDLFANVAIIEIGQQTRSLLKTIESLTITDEQSLAVAVETGVIASKMLKDLELARKKFVDPLNKELKETNAFFKRFIEPLSSLKQALADQISAYHKEQVQIKLEEQRRAQAILDKQRAEAIQQGKHVPSVAIDLPPEEIQATVQSDTGQATARKRWTYKVVDLQKVPRRYLCLDTKAINEEIRIGAREIPGLEIYQETGVSFR